MNDEGHAISLDLAGHGEQEEILKTLAESKQDKIRFHGVVTGDALRVLLANADVGLVPMFPKTYVAVPYKLADYAAAGLPVISSLKGETEDLINKYDSGWFYDAGDCSSLRTTLLSVLQSMQATENGIDQFGVHSKQMAEENFDAEKLYPDFVRWLEVQFKTRYL
jgi:glycosyltransferase involved in cell wall biosynthesis